MALQLDFSMEMHVVKTFIQIMFLRWLLIILEGN